MEKYNISTRAKARIVLYIATLIVVFGTFAIVQTVKANRYEKESMILRQMALIALDENLNNISTNLEKTIYVSTPTMLSKLSAELWREASGAKNNLSILPTGENTVNNTYKFLSQIGEFVMSLERKSASGEQLTDNEREQLNEDERERRREFAAIETKLSKREDLIENNAFQLEILKNDFVETGWRVPANEQIQPKKCEDLSGCYPWRYR